MIEEAIALAIKNAVDSVSVYPVYVPENVDPPYASYTEVDLDENSMVIEVDAVFSVGLEASNYRESKQMAEAIRLAFVNGFTFSGGCVTEAETLKRTDQIDRVGEMYWTRSQFKLLFNNDAY